MRFTHKSTNSANLLLVFILGDKNNAYACSGDLREDNDIKQEVIAKILNVSQATYSRYEKRRSKYPRIFSNNISGVL